MTDQVKMEIIHAGVTEESAAAWWLKRYAGIDGPLFERGKLVKRGTPIFDTNWSPAAALVALKYRAIGWHTNQIAKALGKSWHAIADLFTRVDIAEARMQEVDL